MRRPVRQLIAEKRQWHTPPDPELEALGFRGWHSRGYLPHFDQPGLVQMINYRLDDALPASRRQEWAALLEIEDDRERRIRLEAYLDRGHGSCVLKDALAASIVEENWLHFDGDRYRLLAWVVMPNHVHLLVEIGQVPQSDLVRNWKGYTAHRINRLRGTEGTLWQADYWDRYIRDEEHFRKAVRYVEANPVKAGLVRSPAEWGWSSARRRDEYGRLPGQK